MGKTDTVGMVAVFGATGRQGGATARALLGRGCPVRALTRRPNSAEAVSLLRLGAEVRHVDLDRPETLEPALSGTHAVFSVQNFWESGYETNGKEREVQQAEAVIQAAESIGTEHFVQASVASAHEAPHVPHFDAKRQVEESLRDSSLNWTILRPAAFMQDFAYERDDLLKGTLRAWPMPSDTVIKLVDTETIGRVAAAVFAEPDRFTHKSLAVVSDSVTVQEITEVFSEQLGIPIEHLPMTWKEFESNAGTELTAMYRFFADHGLEGDPADTRAIVPNAPRLAQFVSRLGWKVDR